MKSKLVLRVLICASLAAPLAIPGAAAAQTLLSQGKPATASSVEASYVAANAVDGNAGTRWGSAFSDPQWISVDLGATATIGRVVVTVNLTANGGIQNVIDGTGGATAPGIAVNTPKVTDYP